MARRVKADAPIWAKLLVGAFVILLVLYAGLALGHYRAIGALRVGEAAPPANTADGAGAEPKKTIAAKTPPHWPASNLVRSFRHASEANPVVAADQFDHRFVRVSGVVSRFWVSEDSYYATTYYVVLRSPAQLEELRCGFSEKGVVARLGKGQSVTVQGLTSVSHMLGDSIMLDGCEVIGGGQR